MMFLDGTALRFCHSQPNEVRENLLDLEETMRQAFVSPRQQLFRRQELNIRTHWSSDKVIPMMWHYGIEFTADIRVNYAMFRSRFKPDLKKTCNVATPCNVETSSYAEAVDVARLKNSQNRQHHRSTFAASSNFW